MACPEVKSESVGVDFERSRKRVRDCQDVSERAKRQRPPSRPRGPSTLLSADRLRHSRSPPALDSSRGFPTDLPTASAGVPLGAGPSQRGKGSFSDSMANNLENLIAACMQCNSAMSLPQAVVIAKNYLRSQDPLNLSYTSARSGRGALGRRDSASALLYVPETPKALDLVSKEGGGGFQESHSS